MISELRAAQAADAAGGKGVVFNTITVSDGISMGTPGMRYSLVSREIIADSIEAVTGAEGFDGYEIVEYKGMCWGISMRSKDVGQDCAMGLKTFSGGELTSYTALGDEARQRAVDEQSGATFDDPVLHDGRTYYYLVE